MAYLLGLAQCASCMDKEENLRKARQFAEKAKAAGVGLLVFPESFMMPYEAEKDAFLQAAEGLDGPFAEGMGAIAREFGLWMVFCMIEKPGAEGKSCEDADGRAVTDIVIRERGKNAEELQEQGSSSNKNRTYNTAVLMDDRGTIQSIYHKTHVYDAFGERESDCFIPGEKLPDVVETPFGKIALGICYDLRFPELARHAALAGCQLLVYPAAWVKGNHKALHWQTLLTARAIENGIFIAGCSYVNQKYLGESRIIDPYGESMAAGGGQEELVIGEVDLEKVGDAQGRSLSLVNRRRDLY